MAPQQTELFDLSEIEGYSVLTRREREFVRAIFEGCSQREAAKRAGYEGADYVLDVSGSRAIRSAKVQKILNQAWDRAGASIDMPLRQAVEILMRGMAEWRTGASAEQRKAAREEWETAADFIARIHGKMKIGIEGTIHHTHQVGMVPVPQEALPALAALRRESIAAGRS